MKRSRLIGGMVVLALAGSAVIAPAISMARPMASSAAKKKKVVTMSGSTSVAPLAALLAKGYNKKYPGRTKFKLAQGGSDVGVADVAAGRVSIGNSSRDPKPSDPGGLKFNKIARDALCVVTNNANAIANLSQQQVQAIFAGDVRSWGDVQGAQTTGTINVVVRTAASGTQDAFQKLFMGSKKISSSASQKASNGLIQQAVKSDPNAIGYVSLAFAQGIHPTAFQGVACTLPNAKSGQYGGARNFWMVTRGQPIGEVAKFLNYINRNKAAQKIISREWVPLF